MTTQIQRRRGTTAQHSTFTGAEAELTVDTTKDTVVVHDGATAGGRPLLREDQSNLPTSAPTTGIYNASGSLAISTSSSERLRITSDGKVGLGSNASSPQGTLHVKAPSATTPLIVEGPSSEFARVDQQGRWLVGTSTTLDTNYGTPGGLLQVTGTPLPVIFAAYTDDIYGGRLDFVKSRSTTVNGKTIVQNGDGLGSVIWGGADGANIIPAASFGALVDGTPGANDMPGRLVFSTTADGASSPTERMRITNGGTLLYGNISSAPSASVFGLAIGKDGDGGYIQISRNNTGSTTHVTFANPNGVVGSISTNGSSTAFNTSSDYRLKENVVAVTDGITRLQQLKPSRFNFIADPDTTVDGFIAHEVQAVVPEAITGEKDAVDDEGNPQYQGIDQSKLVPLLTAALQEAVAKIESLEARLTAAGI